MENPWMVIAGVLAVALFFVLVPRVAHVFAYYRAARKLPCPETGATARVDIDAARAAWSSAFGAPRLRATWCTLWPARRDCAQACLATPGAERPPQRGAP